MNSNLELGNHLSVCLETEENPENARRDDRSQELSDAYSDDRVKKNNGT